VSEYKLLSDNPVESTLEYIKTFANYDVNKMKTYKYDLYQKRFLEWKDNCSYKDRNDKVAKITPQSLLKAIKDVDFYVNVFKGLVISTAVIILLLVLELHTVSTVRKEQRAACCMSALLCLRRILSLAACGFWGAGLYFMYSYDGVREIKALANNHCTNDKILHATFKDMESYLKATQLKENQYLMIGCISLVALTLLVSVLC